MRPPPASSSPGSVPSLQLGRASESGGGGAVPGQGERVSDRPASWPSPRGFVSSCWTFPCKSVCEQRATSGATEGARPVQGLPVPWAPTLNTHEGAAPNTQVPSEPPYLLL